MMNPTDATITANEKIYARYLCAKALLQKHTVLNSQVLPVWIPNSQCFWYEKQLPGNAKEFRLVNADLASNSCAFDHQALALALSEAAGQPVDMHHLPINDLNGQLTRTIDLCLNPLTVHFSAFDQRWSFVNETHTLTAIEQNAVHDLISPDGQKMAFTRDYNLWVRDLRTLQEQPLTSDGEEDYQYAIPGSVFGNDAFVSRLGLQACWSPDSKRLLTVQLDQRQVKTVGVVSHVPEDGSLRPQTVLRKLAFPGDAHIETYRLLAIDVETARCQEASYGRVPVTFGGSGGFFENSLGWWNTDSKTAYFVDVDRYYKYARVIAFNTDNGVSRILFEETSSAHVDLFMGAFDRSYHVPLPESHELLWYSNRSGWSHYYLYDLKTGELKNTITSGEWLVRDFIRVDTARRTLFITTAGREPSRDPYYRDLVRVNIDSGEMTPLMSSDHEITAISPNDILQSIKGYVGTSCGVSPSGDFAVVTRSRIDQMPETYLLNRDGEKVLELELPNITDLPKTWQWPEPVKLMAADGKTDLYGAIYRPSDFSPDKTYPIIDQSFIGYPCPIVAKGSFQNSLCGGLAYFEAQALAELGFIVVQIDGRGSRHRGQAFMDESYGWMDAVSHIDDHVAGIQQLAERFPFMDIDRVGICGLHMGGNGVLEGLLKYPDFFTVGVAAQIYDIRIMGANQGDLYVGETPRANEQYPEERVDKLKGKMLLMVGLQDYVPAAATFRIVEALQKSNKDFDLMVDPNGGYSANPYQIRRAWDYFLQHLKGEQPPKEFNLESP